MFSIRATDNGNPRRSALGSVTIFITRAVLPVFRNTPYATQVQENRANATQIYTVTAVDADGRGQMMYEVVGIGAAPSFFYVGSGGVIFTRGILSTDRALEYTLRVIAYDSTTPQQRATADVQITVLRNVNLPVFNTETYTVTIQEETAVGTSILRVTATDADADFLTFTLSAAVNSACTEYFYIRETTGDIHLARSVLNVGSVSYQCTVTVSDNGYPNSKIDTAVVNIFVVRDTTPPVFTNNARYQVTINEDRPVGNSIIQVSASRQGSQGLLYYDEIGDYPGQSFFNINNRTGDVTVQQNLRNDVIRLGTYTLRVVAYDTSAPRLSATAEVFITVLRNLNGPIFNPQIYRVIIDESTPVSRYIQKLNVSDSDGDDLTCSLVSETGSFIGTGTGTYFQVDPSTCFVYVNNDLNADVTKRVEYTLSVRATDNRTPIAQSTTATVIVTVLRDLAPPRFTNLPFSIDLNEKTVINSSVYVVTAVDTDLEGLLIYTLDGDFPVQSFIDLNSRTGQVTLRNSLLSDTTQNTVYTAQFGAYDSFNQNLKARGTLTIRVLRNQNGPLFNPSAYERTIADTYEVGADVITLTATDADGDEVFYSQGGDSTDLEYFYVNPTNGVIRTRKSLTGSVRNSFTFTVRALDVRPQGVQKTAQATVTINVLRDSAPPQFVNTPYRVTVPINQAVGSSFYSVRATDNDLKGTIMYRLEGFVPGTNFFSLNSTTGNILVKSSLLSASLNIYQEFTLLVSAYDSGAPLAVVRETVTIIVNRNLNTPLFDRQLYEDTVYDYEPVGTSVLVVNARDADITSPENLVLYNIQSSSTNTLFNMFTINPGSGLISINRPLTTESINNYRFIVTAEDLSYPFRSSTASVNINVIRNNNSPVFTQLGQYGVTISENTAVLIGILNVTATDIDEGLNGQIFYSIVNSPVSGSIFGINSVTGQIYPRISLLAVTDNAYTLTVAATDNGVVPRSTQATVTIRILREADPSFSAGEYQVTIPEDRLVGTLVFDLNATEPRRDSVLVYDIYGEGDAGTQFRIDSNGRITLAISQLSSAVNSYVVRVQAYRALYPEEKATCIVRVFISRNSAAPRFQHGDLTFTLNDNQLLGVTFGIVNSTDADTGRNGEIRYSISATDAIPTDSREFFYVNPLSGALSAIKRLSEDTDQPDRYTFYIIASDQGVPSLSASVRVTVIIIRNRNAPVFRRENYAIIINENAAIGASVLSVLADDADNHAISYTIIASTSGTFFFNINSNGVISVTNDLTRTGVSFFDMIIEARDNPGSSGVSRFDTATVNITVTRNPNAPQFSANLYNATISEYIEIQQSVVRTIATDVDAGPSGVVRYSISRISYTPPNGFAQFAVSATEGSIYIAQPLTREGVPNTFEIIVVATDLASVPRSASATVTISIIRNQFAPLFDKPEYRADVSDFWAVGRLLFTATAVDNDRNVSLSRETANARFNYQMDPVYPYEAQFFGITKDGTLYVKQHLQNADGRLQFQFYIIAIDDSWKPLSSRALVNVGISYSNFTRTLGFAIPTQYATVQENFYTITANNSLITTVNVTNTNIGSRLFCEILLINSNTSTQVPRYFDLFRLQANGDSCELRANGNLDANTMSLWNITIGVREVPRTKRQTVEVVQVYRSYQMTNLIIAVIDVNNNAPVFKYPVYPAGLNDVRTYFGVIGRFSMSNIAPVTLVATDADVGENGRVSYNIVRNAISDVPFFADPINGRIFATREFVNTDPIQFKFTAQAGDNAVNLQNSVATDVIIDVIENKNRYILVLNTDISVVSSNLERIRVALQNVIGRIIVIETVTYQRFILNGILSVDYKKTDVIFVVVNDRNQYNLFDAATDELNLVSQNTGPSVTILNNIRQAVNLFATVERMRVNFPVENIMGFSDELKGQGLYDATLRPVTARPYKSYIWWIEDAYSGLLALAAIIIVLGFIALIILIYQWQRYNTYLKNYRVYHRNYEHQPDFTNPPSFLKEYETQQTLDMYMPPDETVQDLGEINMSFVRGDSTRRTGEVRKISTRNPVYDNSGYHVKMGQVHY